MVDGRNAYAIPDACVMYRISVFMWANSFQTFAPILLKCSEHVGGHIGGLISDIGTRTKNYYLMLLNCRPVTRSLLLQCTCQLCWEKQGTVKLSILLSHIPPDRLTDSSVLRGCLTDRKSSEAAKILQKNDFLGKIQSVWRHGIWHGKAFLFARTANIINSILSFKHMTFKSNAE